MKLKLILTMAIVGVALALPGVSSAWAQAPPNDTFEQATVISSLPFSQILDTSEATTDSTDAEAGASCGVPSVTFAATVWYEYTPPVDQSLVVSTSGSSLPRRWCGVLTGSPGSLSAVDLLPRPWDRLGDSGSDLPHRGGRHRRGQRRHAEPFRLDAGVRTQRRSLRPVRPQDGGRNCHRHPRRPPPHARVGSRSSFPGPCPSGRAATTTADTGANPMNVPCNGALPSQQWSITFTPLDGKFKGGPADVSADAVNCLFLGCLTDHADRRVILRG